MKNLILFILCLFAINLAQAQQDLFNYQAVARDASNNPIKNQDIALRFTIYDDDVQQTIRYIETHSVKTSDLGIFSVFIGDGTPQQGQMSAINWGNNDFAMTVEVDLNNGTNYEVMGDVRFLSVPYALHARTVEDKDDADADPQNEIQTISKNGNTITLSGNGGTVTDEINDADADPQNEMQSLSINGTQLTISGGNTVNLPTGGSGGTNDDDPNNEIQDLSSSKNGNMVDLGISLGGQGTTIDISDNDNDATNELQDVTAIRNGNVVTLNISGGQGSTFEVQDDDADMTNEIQSLSKNGNMIQLSLNGGSVVDAVNDADADPQNEIQDISLNGTKLSIAGGSEVELKDVGYWEFDPNTNRLGYTDNPIHVSEVFQGDENVFSKLDRHEFILNDEFGQISSTIDVEGLYTSLSNEMTWAQYGVNGTMASKDGIGITHEFFDRSLKYPDYVYNLGESIYSKDSMYISNYSILDAEGQARMTYSNFQMGLANRLMNLWASEMKMENFETPGVGQNSVLSADSLSFNFGGSNGMAPTSTSRLDNWSLNFVDVIGESFGCISSTEVCLKDNFFGMNMSSLGLIVREKISPQDEFERIALLPGGLSLWNGAKWNNVFLGDSDNGNAGVLKLNNGTGLGRIASLGAIDGVSPTEGGNLQLYYRDAIEPMVWLDGSAGYGELCLFNKNDNCYFQVDAHGLVSFGGNMDISDTAGVSKVRAYVDTIGSFFGVNETKGVVEVFGDVMGGIVGSFEGDTIYSSLDNYGVETERTIAVNRERRLRSSPFSIVDHSMQLFTGGWDEGKLLSTGPEGSINVEISTSAELDIGTNADYGAIYVHDDNSVRRAGMEVRQFDGLGVIWADIKNFRIDHPEKEDKEIVYASLEGPEAAAYSRGTSTLENGRIFVQFPEHFRHVANPETMTIQLTPLYANTIGLAVVEKTSEGFWVQERMDGSGSFDFDWQATCVRKGYEDFEVIREKKMIKK